ncbi:flagellar hook-basal body protein [Lysobacter yananisis]|uniref:Flagellar basal-body rod protein n=2 Tax=Lysobacter TaxID=68 RepID=A0A0S2DN19_LYSEN|nr:MULTISPECIES: flagellar hook-basal body protein [Lysobacter]ALN59970.1 flagellar basal-body rod protein [Lysobacter enzymogenes]QCW28014.1 flagellar hook-basal body protein [Lysobacter enzymogenes]UZW61291.1 flagellar hook-basal body protein [Lysobacter enzymogenes]WMT05165.1 flagellar hook-basal body protein [Lysobacter yananisis]
MNGIFYIGATGLDAQGKAVETVANNVANINTAAYKRGTVSFSELLSADAANGAAGADEVKRAAAGVMANPTLHVFAQGDLRPTGNDMDIAVQGEGFLELAGGDGRTTLWRGGTLRIGADGFLAAANGLPLASMIAVPADAEAIHIAKNGMVTATLRNERTPVEIGQIELAVPADLQRMESLGDGLYALPDDALSVTRSVPGEDKAGLVAQGFSEASNIKLADEMVSLMIYQRAYASSARLVQIGDELMGIANGLKR